VWVVVVITDCLDFQLEKAWELLGPCVLAQFSPAWLSAVASLSCCLRDKDVQTCRG
jgi:hypothetical protein